METLILNQKDWPPGSRALVTMPEALGLTEVQILEWSPSAEYVRVRLFDGANEPRYWLQPETNWDLIERLKGGFGQ